MSEVAPDGPGAAIDPAARAIASARVLFVVIGPGISAERPERLPRASLADRTLADLRARCLTTPVPVAIEVLGRLLLAASGTGMVVTSNVDGALQQAGVDRRRITEVDGSLLWDRCLARCGQPPWEATGGPSPVCPRCGGRVGPDVRLAPATGEPSVPPDRFAEQERRRLRNLEVVRTLSTVVVEVGEVAASSALRRAAAAVVATHAAPLVRIAPEPPAGADHLVRAEPDQALSAIAAAIERRDRQRGGRR